MNFAVLDYETFFSDDFTLSKMSTEAYIRDPRCEAHGAAFKASPDLPAKWFNGAELPDLFASIDWANTFLICHHHQFDGLILSHVYGCQPAMRGCTLSMARLLLGNHIGVSLDSVRKEFGLHPKTTPYSLFKGRHWQELAPAVAQQVAQGACDEVESIWHLFKQMMQTFPREELEVVDTTMRMFTDPVLRGDVDMFARIWENEESSKGARMAALGVTEGELQSAARFADLLREQGVEPEMKEGKKAAIYAFAKTDQFMRDLAEHENETVRLLAQARLGAKSTIMQTRAETLGFMACRGPMPVYLRYAGAHTTRWSGGDGANWQNFKRGSDLRKAISAPEGYLLAPIDLSQIEVRILDHLAGQWDELEKFKAKDDPYINIASRFYGENVYKAQKQDPRFAEMEAKRGTGKQAILSCGYQCGATKFKATARLGIYGPPVHLSLEESEKAVQLYRDTHPCVVDYWKTAGRMIARLAGGNPLEWGPMLIKDKKIYGPGGTMLIYDTLEFHHPADDEEVTNPYDREGYWRFRTRNGWTKLYSGKLVENVVQWLARIVMSQAMVRIVRLGYRITNTTHDELLVLIPRDGREEQHLEICRGEMKREPTWLPGIPLDAEASLSERYSK